SLQPVRTNGMPDLIEACLGLYAINTGLEPAYNRQPSRPPLLEIIPVGRDLGLHCHGHEQCRVVTTHNAVKPGRRNTDHRERASVDRNTLVDNLGIGTKTALPIIK